MSDPITLCHHCDLLVKLPAEEAAQTTHCPRCHADLPHDLHQGLQAPMALCLAGCILVVPANTLPIMTLSILGNSNANTMLNGVLQLFDAGYWWMAFLVFLCSVLAPVMILGLRFAVCLAISTGAPSQWVVPLLKGYQHLTHWSSLDVYMLGILVAIIKLVDLGDLVFGPGLYSFIALLLLSSWSTATFNAKALWSLVSRSQHQGKTNR
ncbi:paraquat-inducible protein A [Pseudomaricurvus alkylphenolicus]|uniref:paraquat-inducible protein A n=1 Tax=Pseudomaricurvus alkylphenolicus TaxID=1306991 RepID=UPI001421A562|nr:paraquat-inducible protein A [Pseudomaricurvus alkylphenolicus]NIB42680.1 paraquat-inducible protein A [Pseudomaricurvus alkylphenolicus]